MAALGAPELARIVDELGAVRVSLDRSAEDMLALIEQALDSDAGADLSPLLHQMLSVCGFGDLAGQRLAAIGARLSGAIDTRPDAALMHGPSDAGLKQDEADALFASIGAQG